MQEMISQIRVLFWMTVHYRWPALTAAAVVCLGGWVLVHFLPDQYEVETRVYMDTQTVLTPLLKGLTVDNAMREGSAEIMKRTLVSRPNLEEVIRATDMDFDVNGEFEYEGLIQNLISKIEISGGQNSNNIYTLKYSNKDAELAKKVVDKLLNIFLENILGLSRSDSSTAGTFLSQQIASYQKRLEETEKLLADFKAENPLFTPTTDTNYTERLELAKQNLEAAKLEMAETQRKYQILDQETKRMAKALSDEGTSGAVSAAMQSPLDIRIAEVKKSLDQLLLGYTDQHPDVIATRRLLKGLEQQRDEQRGAATAANGGVTLELSANPLYQQVSLARDNAKSTLAGLKARVDLFEEKVANLQSAIGAMPELETKYKSLTRNYQIVRSTYEQLVQRSESAALGRQVDEKTDAVQFRIIDPPIVPVLPVGPNRPLFHTLVLFVGLGLGMGLAISLAQMRPTFYSQAQLAEQTDLPILGTVSMVWTGEQIKARKKGIVFYLAFLLALLGTFIGVILMSVLR